VKGLRGLVALGGASVLLWLGLVAPGFLVARSETPVVAADGGPLSVNVVDLGARPDGTDPEGTTRAFQRAIARGGPIDVPAGDYLIQETLELRQNAVLRGVGYATSSGVRARSLLRFTGLGDRPAIVTRHSNETGLSCGLEGLVVLARSWVGAGACSGPGCVFEAPVTMRNCYVGNFRQSNLILHHDASRNGPYESLFENVYSAYSGQHGCVVGTGAHVATFMNCRFFWNGSPSFGKPPIQPGAFDGFFVSARGEGNPGGRFPDSVPHLVTIIGGDASYNSRYGWNLEQVQASDIRTGFAEHNLQPQPGQVHIGSEVDRCHIVIPVASGYEQGVDVELGPGAWARNTLFVCGRLMDAPPANRGTRASR
jgi:hypothetical protein